MTDYNPAKKIDLVRKAAARGDWQACISITSKFPSLGAERDVIMKAREAFCRPDFQRQLGRDPDELIAQGVSALRRKYNV